VTKVELELDTEVPKSESKPYIYTASPEYEEEFGPNQPSSHEVQGDRTSIIPEVNIPPIGKIGLNIPVQRGSQRGSVSKNFAVIKEDDRMVLWSFNSSPLIGLYKARAIIGIPIDASSIIIKLCLVARITYKFRFFRGLMSEELQDYRAEVQKLIDDQSLGIPKREMMASEA
jgi:hypothetical protein